MGVQLSVLAVGAFNEEIVKYLGYPVAWYQDVKPGTPVMTCVVETITKHGGEAVAESFGSKLYDLGTHCYCSPDIFKLSQLVVEGVIDDDERKAVLALKDAGFKFLLLLDA